MRIKVIKLGGGLQVVVMFALGPTPALYPQTAMRRIVFAVWPGEKGKVPDEPLIDPILVMVGSHLQVLADYNNVPDAFFKHFDATYYRPGRAYPLLMRGSQSGTLAVHEPSGIYCVSLVATVKLPVVLDKSQVALAVTSTNGLGLHENWRKTATTDQRSEFLRLVSALLKEKASRDVSVSNIEIESVYSTKLGAGQPDSLVGNATLTEKTTLRHLFLVATKDGGEYRVALSSYHFVRDVEDHTDDVDERFVDQLDLDNDGADEIITIVSYTESWDYIVYKQVQGTWEKIYEGGGGGC